MNTFDWKLFRRDVRRDVRNCSLFLFFFYGVNLVAVVIITVAVIMTSPAVSGLTADPQAAMNMFQDGFSGTDGMSLIDEAQNSIGQFAGLMSIVGIIAGGCVFFILRGRRFITDLAMPAAEPLTPKIFIILVLATQAIQLVFSLIVTLIDTLLPEGLSLTESYGAAMDTLATPTGLVYVILIGPIFEELVFRGAIMGSLRRFGDNFAIIFSSILFGFYHAIILQIPFGFVMGLLLGYVAARWSMRLSIVLHIIVNGLSMLFTLTGNEGVTTVGGLFMIVCLVLTVIFAIKWREIFVVRVRAGSSYYPKTYANGFSSIAFWIFLVVMALVGVFQMSALTVV